MTIACGSESTAPTRPARLSSPTPSPRPCANGAGRSCGSVDDFHHVRAVRYRLGRGSAEGFWLHAFDYGRLRGDVLDPLASGGSRRYRPRAHDLATDAVLDPEPIVAPPGAVLVVDGLFLHRDELRGAFDRTVFLDVPFEVTVRRALEEYRERHSGGAA
jgi:uridine kinase